MRAWTLPGERLEARFFTPDIPKPQPTPTPPTDTAAQDAAEAQARKDIRKRKGRSATVLTSPAGAGLGKTGTLGEGSAGPGFYNAAGNRVDTGVV